MALIRWLRPTKIDDAYAPKHYYRVTHYSQSHQNRLWLTFCFIEVLFFIIFQDWKFLNRLSLTMSCRVLVCACLCLLSVCANETMCVYFAGQTSSSNTLEMTMCPRARFSSSLCCLFWRLTPSLCLHCYELRKKLTIIVGVLKKTIVALLYFVMLCSLVLNHG